MAKLNYYVVITSSFFGIEQFVHRLSIEGSVQYSANPHRTMVKIELHGLIKTIFFH